MSEGQYFDKAIEIDKDFADAYSNRGRIYLLRGQYHLAIADLNKAIGVYPDIDVGYYYRGLAYAGIGNNNQAIADIKKVIDITTDPELIRYAEQALSELEY